MGAHENRQSLRDRTGRHCTSGRFRAIHMDIRVFNTNKHISISPIEIICADHYEGGVRHNENPIILAYNGIHFESLETMSTEDDKKAIELVNLKKTDGYILNKKHIELMTRISQTKKTPQLVTKEPEHKANVS